MEFNKDEKIDFKEVLKDCFREINLLRPLLNEELDLNLDDLIPAGITGENSFFEVVQEVVSQGKHSHLVFAVSRQKPGNQKLKKFLTKWINSNLDNVLSDSSLDRFIKSDDCGEKLLLISSRSGISAEMQGFYKKHVSFLKNTQCNELYAKALTLLFWSEFPEKTLDLLKERETPISSATQVAHLIILLKDSGPKNEQVIVGSRIFISNENLEYQSCDDALYGLEERSVTIENRRKDITKNQKIGEKVRYFIDVLENKLSETYSFDGQIVIHFFVENNRMNDTWDQWKCLNGNVSQAIGQGYPVIVHSIDRYDNPRYIRELRNKLNEINQCKNEKYGCINSIDDIPDDVIGIRWNNIAKGDKKLREQLEKVMTCGLPLVIWFRCSDTDKSAEDVITNELLTIDAIRSPENLFKKVRNIRRKSDILNKNLTVWWDDPNLHPNLPGFGEVLAGGKAS